MHFTTAMTLAFAASTVALVPRQASNDVPVLCELYALPDVKDYKNECCQDDDAGGCEIQMPDPETSDDFITTCGDTDRKAYCCGTSTGGSKTCTEVTDSDTGYLDGIFGGVGGVVGGVVGGIGGLISDNGFA